MLMGVEVLLNAIGVNIVAFWRYSSRRPTTRRRSAILIVTIGAVEMAIGLAIMMLLYRQRHSVEVDGYAELRR